MTNSITLQCSQLSTTTAVRLLNGEFTYQWKNLVSADPSNSVYGNVETQFTGWENPIINLTFHIPTDNIPSGSMTWALWNEFTKNQYDSTNANTQVKLAVTYGSSDSSFTDYSAASGSKTSIPVTIKSYSLRFSPSDSRNSAHWTISAQLQVTK